MKSCNIWIFDVGHGFAAAILTPAGKWIVIDLGASDDFNPVTDFLLTKKLVKFKDGRKEISQLILSHPHNDHMTCIKVFKKHIHPAYLTVPNDIDHENQPSGCKVNWDLVTNQSDDLTNFLRDKMFPDRRPPLIPSPDDRTNGFRFEIYYLPPELCENDDNLTKANYTNNLSILARLYYMKNIVLFTGDMMKDGMEKILQINDKIRSELKKVGVDFLIAPHHGLRSAFSTRLFSAMKDGKTRGLNIISQRPTSAGSTGQVDDRYGSDEFCEGHNVIINGEQKRRHRISTSASGHIRIRLYENGNSVVVAGKSALDTA